MEARAGATAGAGALRAGFDGGAAAGTGVGGGAAEARTGTGAVAAASRAPSERSAVSISPRATSERVGLENGGLAASATTRSNPASRSGGSRTATTTDSPVCSAFSFLLIALLFTVGRYRTQVTPMFHENSLPLREGAFGESYATAQRGLREPPHDQRSTPAPSPRERHQPGHSLSDPRAFAAWNKRS